MYQSVLVTITSTTRALTLSSKSRHHVYHKGINPFKLNRRYDMTRKTSSAQQKASRRWEEKNRDRTNYLTYRRTSRNFIKNRATLEDLSEFKELIEVRELELESE